MKKNRWITTRVRALRPRLRSTCFPYAGRGASMYAGWQAAFSSDVEICPVQLPGREDRLGEPAACRIDPLVDSFLASVGEELDSPFVFFGHSMGGVVAYEIARRLQGSGARGPELLIVSASEPPHASRDATRVYELPDDELVAELRSWKGNSGAGALRSGAAPHPLANHARRHRDARSLSGDAGGLAARLPHRCARRNARSRPEARRAHALARAHRRSVRPSHDRRRSLLHQLQSSAHAGHPHRRCAELARVRPRRTSVAALPVPARRGA